LVILLHFFLSLKSIPRALLRIALLKVLFFSLIVSKIKADINISVILVQKTKSAGYWWLMPVILATQEADIRRIMASGQPRQIF
jgi:hypothetical protein